MRLHDEKPSVADRSVSQAVDIVIWRPREQSESKLVELLTAHGLGERSQTVVWLDKFTVRLTMWRRRYLALLTDSEWTEAAEAIVQFLEGVHTHYQPRRMELDTRAFTVGIEQNVRRRRMPVGAFRQADHSEPLYWELVFPRG